MAVIGEFLGDVREKAGLTQAEVATLRHTSRGSQSQLEMASANPRWASIEAFATAIGARLTLRFDLFNGASAEMVAGQVDPNLRGVLYAERKEWEKNPRFESAIAALIAEVVAPEKWARQNALKVLVSAAIGENLRGPAGFDFELDFGHWEDDDGNWDLSGSNYVEDTVSVLDQNRVTLRRLIEQVVNLVRRAGDEKSRQYLPITSSPAFLAFVSEGAPGAQSIADQMVAIAADPLQTDGLLAAIGFLPADPHEKARNHNDA